MSMARRCAKCNSACLRCAAHTRPPEQRESTSPGSRTATEPHTGQCAGMRKASADGGRRSASTPTTSGMTSPARRTITVSPTRTSLRSTSLEL